MSDLPEVTEDKLRLVNVVSCGYMLVGVTFIALRLSSGARLIGRVIRYQSEMDQQKILMLVVMLLMAAFAFGLGGLLIGGGIYLRRRLENARITLIVTSFVLIAMSLYRALQTIPVIVLLSHASSYSSRSGSFGSSLHQQFASAGIGLLLAIVLGILLALITGPAVKDAMLPKTPPASAVPPPAWPAMK